MSNESRTSNAHLADIPLGKLMVLITFQASLFTLAGLALWWCSDRNTGDFLGLDQPALAQGLLLGGFLSAVAALCFLGFPKITDRLVRFQGETNAFLKNPLPFWAIVWVSICAGVSEEALFRAGLQTLLGDYVGPIAAIAISSLLFALVHLAKPIVASLIFLIGVLFGVVYCQTGSLVTVMVGHAVYDVFALTYLQRRLHELDFFDDAANTEGLTDAPD